MDTVFSKEGRISSKKGGQKSRRERVGKRGNKEVKKVGCAINSGRKK